MKIRSTLNATPYKNIMYVALATAALLLIPLVAMQFSHDVDWTPLDFAVAGTLLFGTGLAYVLATRKMTNPRYKAIVGGTLAVMLLIIWAELSVGIFS